MYSKEVGMRRAIVLSALVWVEFCAAAQQPRFDGKTWWHHVEVLAADNMEGRGTGSPGLQRAEAYVVDQLQKSGLRPAGTHGYYQPIKFESREVIEGDSSVALVRNGKAEPLALGEDAFFLSEVDLTPKLEAPLVFLGYGINVPEKSYNDFAGLDLKGKVAVTMAGGPEGIGEPLASHYLRMDQRWKQFRDAGLIGWIVIPTPGPRDSGRAAGGRQRRGRSTWPAMNRTKPGVLDCGLILRMPKSSSWIPGTRRRSCSRLRRIASRYRASSCDPVFAPPRGCGRGRWSRPT
jgi:hypothetical protein